MKEHRGEKASGSSGSSSQSELIPGYSSIEQFTKDGFKVLMESIKNSNALPSGRDWNFYNTSDSFKRIINDESSNVLRLMNNIMRCHEIDSNIRNRVLDEKIELIIEANDVILEKVANNIDDLNGIRTTTNAPVVLQTVSAQLPVNGSWNKPNVATFSVNSSASKGGEKDRNCIKLLTAKNIIRPQKFFKDKVDNRNKVPWCPRINDKPNSLKPLAIFLEEFEDRQEYSHPYEFELFRFAPTPEQLLEEKPKKPKPLLETPLMEINKPEQLPELVETLRKCKEFSVDVEHHSYRSFMGITCLLQISTQDTDYLIDALALRDKLCVLNEVFTKNNIVKIFHGADHDIQWLQRDLSIYVVNMFDTHQAAKLLEYPGLSLAFLLKKFCDISPNKQYQLADWRIRELPEELKQYAREDTHYLIYIYKMLKKELLAKGNGTDNLLRAVIEQSTEICKSRYFKPVLNDDSHLEIYRRCKKFFDNRQLYALKEIFYWRDHLAREEDESCGFVLPNHMLLQIAETLPREMQGILACCNPIPPLVRSHLLELHQIVLKAREQPLEKAIMKDTTGRGVLKKVSKVNVDSVLNCPHDLSKSNEFRDDLPTLLKNDNYKAENRNISNMALGIEKSSCYSIFNGSDNEVVFNERETFKKMRGFDYFSPYERYKLVKPFAIAEDKKEEEEKQTETEQTPQETMTENSEERTDADRIASIKDHFLQLSRKFSEDLQVLQQKQEELQRQQERSLREMGGTRKRKWDEVDDNIPEQVSFDHGFHSPRPNMHYSPGYNPRSRKRGNKRKFNEMEDQADPVPQGMSHKIRKKNDNQQNQGVNPPNKQTRRSQKQKERKRQFQQQQQFTQQQNQQQFNQQQRQDNYQPPIHNQQQMKNKQKPAQQKKTKKISNLNQQNAAARKRLKKKQINKQNQGQQQQQQNAANQQQQNARQKKRDVWKQNQGQMQQQQNKAQPQQQQSARQRKRDVWRQNQGQMQQQQNKAQPQQQQNQGQQQQNQRQKKKNWGQEQQNANFSPYDYSSVDFRQFQGGAGSANTGARIKQGFKPKNWKNKNKQGAKSATFSNPKSNRGGHQKRTY